MRKIKPFENLTFHDDFMFGLVMQDKEICREALECLQDRSVGIDDGAIVHIFNCTAYEKVENESLRAFLKFVQTDMAESEFTRRIGNMVETQKAVESNKKFYLSWSLHDTDVRLEGIAVGKEQGMNEAKIANARNLLAMKLGTHEQIAKAVELPLKKIEELAADLAKEVTLQEE